MLPRVATTLACMVLAGCSSLPGRRAPVETMTVSDEVLQAALLTDYIDTLQIIVQGSPAEQAEVLAETRRVYDQELQGPAVLRYALVLATPGHPARNLQQAQHLLREVLARPELLTSIERALAIVEVARVEDELQLSAENARLVTEARQERERQRTAVEPSATLAKRLQDEINASARLRKDLEEARAKLQAIANIERNIPERTNDPESRKP